MQITATPQPHYCFPPTSGDARVPDAMIQIEGKDWYPDPTGSGSRQQVEGCREDARQTP